MTDLHVHTLVHVSTCTQLHNCTCLACINLNRFFSLSYPQHLCTLLTSTMNEIVFTVMWNGTAHSQCVLIDFPWFCAMITMSRWDSNWWQIVTKCLFTKFRYPFHILYIYKCRTTTNCHMHKLPTKLVDQYVSFIPSEASNLNGKIDTYLQMAISFLFSSNRYNFLFFILFFFVALSFFWFIICIAYQSFPSICNFIEYWMYTFTSCRRSWFLRLSFLLSALSRSMNNKNILNWRLNYCRT